MQSTTQTEEHTMTATTVSTRKARKIYAGPTPDGTYVVRTTANDYCFALAAIDTSELRYAPRDPNADERGYIPNELQGKWIAVSFHATWDAAARKRNRHPSYIIVPVIDGKPESKPAGNTVAFTISAEAIIAAAEPNQEDTNMATTTKTEKAPSKAAQARAAREAKAAEREAAKAQAAEPTDEPTPADTPAGDPVPPVEELPANDEPAVAKADGAKLMADLGKQVKRAVRGAELKTAPSGGWTTVKIGKKPVAYIELRKHAVNLVAALPAAPADVTGLEFKGNTRHAERFGIEALVTSADQFEAALTTVEQAAAVVAA